MKQRRDWTARTIALIALALAVGGGTALAGTHYLITSTKQIKPSVLKALRKAGPPGPQGPQGSQGAEGTQGPKGDTGQPGTNGAVAAYAASGNVVFGSTPVNQILTKDLPAGKFVINAVMSVQANKVSSAAGNTGAAVSCSLGWPAGSQQQTLTSPWDSDDDNFVFGTISFNATGTLTTAGAVTITCTNYSGTNGAQDPGTNANVTVAGNLSALQANSIG